MLVEDALFCHRCGKPQREDLIEREQVAAGPVQAPIDVPAAEDEVLAEAPVGFNSRRATRSAVLAAFASFVCVPLIVMVLGGAASVLTLLAAGFLAVYLYRRGAPAGEVPITARVGARMGWMTGVFAFLLMLVQITLGIVFSDVPLRDMLRRQMEQQAPQSPELQQVIEILNSTPGFAALLGTMIVFLFVAFTLFAMLGGALGAQLQNKAGKKVT